MNKNLYLIVISLLIITTISQTVSFIIGDHQFYQSVQDKCIKCHGDIEVQLSTSDQHKDFSCVNCHTRSANNHTNKQPECSYCHATSRMNDTLEAHLDFSSLGSQGCVACHSTYNAILNYSRPEYIDYTIKNNNGNWIISDFKTEGTLNLSYDAMRQGGKHNIKNVSCKDCHKDIFDAVSLGGHAVVLAKNGTQVDYHNNSNSTPEEWCRTCHNNNDTKFQNQQHSIKKTTCEQCHQAYNLTHPGNFFSSMNTVPHLYRSLVCISCKSAGWPAPGGSIIFNVREEPYYDVEFQIIFPLNITDSSPAGDPTIPAGVSQTFSVTLNRFADITWYNNGSEIFRVLSVISASYTDSKRIPGVYNITAIASDSYDSTARTWIWNVTNATVGEGGGGSGGSGGGIGSGTSNNISGYIFDNVGSPLAGVLVQNGSYQNNTSESGYYSITDIPNGEYNFTYSKAGFGSDYFIFSLGGITMENMNKTLYDTTPPGSVINPNSTTGNFFINNTWINPSDIDFNRTIFRYGNGSTLQSLNNSTNYLNLTFSPHYVQNITAQTVDNFGNENETLIWFNATIPDNIPVLSPIGNKTINEGELLAFNISSVDADNDTMTYGTNATNGTLNATSGEFSWVPGYGDAGVYILDFNSSDGYGGVANETINVTVNDVPFSIMDSSPPVDPITPSGTAQTFGLTFNRIGDVTWYNNGVKIFTIIGISSANYTNSAAGVGIYNITAISNDGYDSISRNWSWNVTAGSGGGIEGGGGSGGSNNSISGYVFDNFGSPLAGVLVQNGSYQNITSPSGYYSITNLSNGTYNFNYSKTGFSTGYFEFSFNGAVITDANKTIYDNTPLDSVSNPNIVTGNFYINNTWTNPADADFNNTNFNYSNGTVAFVANSTTTFWNRTELSPHEIQNISAQTVDTYGNINTTNVWFNITIPNNVPNQTIIGDKTITAGDLLTFTVSATDADNDTITYGTNATRGILNTTTGEYSWPTNSTDTGTYTWYFNSTDNYGGIATEIINVTVTEIPTYLPPVPVNITSSQGSFWINHSWEAGAGNVTDSYNVSVNDIWTNGTMSTYNNTTLVAHGWSNISVYSYNASGAGTLNLTPVLQNIQVANSIPVQTVIGNKTVTAGDLLTFNITATDADNDSITYGTNATSGSLNATTGEYSWPTNSTDTGTYIWYFNSSDNYGGTATETINVTVTEIPAYVPPVPVNLTSTQGNFWINHTWEPGAGNVTDSYNVSVNDIWTNGTTSTYNNSTVEPHGWSNITVYAYNSLGPGTLNATPVYQDIQLANNIPVQTGIGDKTVTAGDLLTFNVTANDLDNDSITYGTNATYGSLNVTTGIYSWPTNASDVGTYVWYFNSTDTYGGTATETITITVTEIPTYLPPDPVNLNNTRGSSWVNYTWEPGAGNVTDSYNVNMNGNWTNGTTSNYINTSVEPHGWSNITVYAYNASGSGTASISPVSGETQVLNTIPLQTPIGDKTVTAGMELTFSIISTDADSDPLTYGTNATRGILNTTSGEYSWPTNASDVGTYVWYFETNDTYGGSATETITINVTEIPTYLPPDPVNLNNTRGSSWVNYTWEPGAGNVTDSYNVNVNGIWTNGTTSTYNNSTIGPHGWSNITVYAYNASGSGTPSLNPVSGETQVLNAAPVQAPIGDKAVTAGMELIFSIISTDADNDTITYGTNATRGTLNTTTGTYSWLTNSTDTGTYIWYFNSTDNYGGIATETITINVTEVPTYLPPDPVNLTSTLSSSWVNYTWEQGSGNITDSYNVNVNGTWTNDTSNNYINTSVEPHGWSNITVYAYNASGSGTLSFNPVSGETQVLNAAPVQAPIGDKTVTAGMELIFSIISTDADNDTITYGTNATRGILNTTSGEYSWPTNASDVGTYVWYFNSSDNYGGIVTETITINVTEIPTYLPPDPVNLSSTQGNFWINYTWEQGSGNVTDSYNVSENGIWTNGTTSTYNNTTVGPHGWSNITIYAYNASGSGIPSLNPASGETQVLNNIPIQSHIDSQTIPAGSLLTFTVSTTDADNDTITYGTNATNGTINATTGEYSWQTSSSDAGTYVWSFTSSDNYGGVADEAITIAVTAVLPTNYTPPSPVNLTSTQGNFWINHNWEAGSGNATDNYNISVNGTWTNGTTSNYINASVDPHGWSNISVYSYNASGMGTLNLTPVSQNIQLANNIPDQTGIGDKTVTAGDLLTLSIIATDADNDTITYGTNATNGIINATTGEYSWQTNSSDAGTYVWNFNSSDNYGGIASETITITVTAALPTNYMPPSPVNLISTQGNFWINHTWEPGAGNDTDSYNVSVNDLWTNGTTATYNNSTVGPHGWSNISVYSYNASGTGILNTTPISNNIQVANNLPYQTAIGNKIVTAGQLLTFTVSTTDADNDTITYGTNATNGSLNATTGEYSWQTISNDVGTYNWSFTSNDNYGGVSSKTITITVTAALPTNYTPPSPVNLTSIQGNFWINHNWEAGIGNNTDSYNVSVNGIWTNGTTANYNNSTVGPHGWSNITVYAYNASGIGTLSLTPASQDIQLANNIPVQIGIGNKTVTAGDLLTFSVTATDVDNDTITYGTNATGGNLNATTGEYSWPTNSTDIGTYVWYFNSTDNYGGTATETINVTVTEIPTYLPPDPVNLTSTLSSSWVNYTWEPGAGNVTDSYNVNVNGTWINGTTSTYNNSTIGPHGWSNITVYAYNASGSGTLSLNPVSGETQVLNTVPVQAPIGDKAVTAGSLLTFTVSATDADNDTITYGTNATNGTINATTGAYSWQTNSSDAGIYTWNFNSSDNYGGIASETITITVTAALPVNYTPPSPVNLISTQGNFWINHSWEAGAGNDTDSYNVSVNDIWMNGTTTNYNNSTVGPHGWSNISVYSYNSSGTGTLNLTSVSQDIQLTNNIPDQTSIGDKTITAGDLLAFNVMANDLDNDTIIYGTNATNGTLNTTTGEYSWPTNASDVGTYVWYFNSTDNYGGTATETITITVTEIPTYLPPAPVNLNSTLSSSWINYTWEPGAGNITDSYNVNINGTWTNGTSNNYINTSVSPHGWSNITVYAYNASGNGTLSLTPVSGETQVLNAAPVQTPIGDKAVTSGNLLTFNIIATDADNDTITYGTNATNGTINATTGAYSWQTNSSDAGIYTWNFNSSDNYGGIASEIITITVTEALPVNYTPPSPVNLISTQGNFWINHTWEAGAGNDTDSYNISVNGTWTNDTISNYINTSVDPHGWSNISVYSYNSSGTGTLNTTPVSNNIQVSNNVPLQTAIGSKAVTAGQLLTFTVSATDVDNDTITYGTNETKGSMNTTTGAYSWQTNSSDIGTYVWYFNSSDPYGGVASETITITVTEIPTYLPSVPVNLTSTQGNFWINYTWQPGSGNVTDSYNVSVNGLWTNGTASTYNNTTVAAHGWSNISVYSYNVSGIGSLNLTPVSQDIQLANNNPIQTGIGDKTITAGDLLIFNVTATDADDDPIIYSTNATNGTINSTTGTYSWQTNINDAGTFTWSFASSDNYGGIASEIITITVTEALPTNYMPPSPVNLISTQDNFWINHTWEAGAGNATDSYNVSVNDIWTNGTTATYNNTTVGPHGWSNISVYAYNNSGTGTLNTTALTRATQVSNNLVMIGNISSSYSITAGDTISIYPTSSDPDLDTPNFDRNFTNGTFYTNNGTFIWTTASSDTGLHSLQINVTDGYGSISSANFTVTVKSLPSYNASGYVFDNLGAGLGDVLVKNGSNQSITSPSGYYSITNLLNGTYNFSYSKAGFDTGYLEITISGANNTTANKTLYDTTPPASVNNIVATSTPLYINWTWSDPSDSDFNHVEVYIDGAFMSNVTKGLQFYNASYFAPNLTHTISTRTVDNFSNVNSTWVNNSAITPSAYTYVSNFLNDTGIVSSFNNSRNASDGAVSVFAEVNVSGLYQLNVTTNITEIPDASIHTLELRYNVSEDNFTMQIWNGSAWNNRSILNNTSMSYLNITLLPEELISDGTLAGDAGSINKSYSLVRYLDVNASVEQQGMLYLDYQRIYNH